ncbi:hypothetical protein [Cytophaga hutchinsonii]|uniref:hypothetical protein n=1 Tax=Cytophaga hutchinsonii TaxID=985 RepID=UPI0005A5115F|nr:hypothetical protein [Cytophaga hutchinsonii]SFX65147.1 hypothetical protein SAMN04487930_10751 [Cytophaga hutchinsonii ATCC 33406]
MKSYKAIKSISDSLYLNLIDETDIQKRLQDAVHQVHVQISEDFKCLFGQELNLKDFHIYVDDETYRQSATGLILNETIIDYEDLIIRVECLIDHGRILITVRKGEGFSDFEDMVFRIARVQNSEGSSELRDII